MTSRLIGEASINDLAGQMEMDRTTLSRNLRPLVREGLVEVVPGEDGRTRLVRVSPAGRVALDRAYPMWQRAQEQLVGALGHQRFESLLDELDRAVTLFSLPSDPGPQTHRRT